MRARLQYFLMPFLCLLAPAGFAFSLAQPVQKAELTADKEPEPKTIPEPAWITPARVIRVIDGDTVEVEIRKTLRVRMLDCWAPESHRDGRVDESEREEQKALGIASKKSLENYAQDRDVILRIPTSNDGDMSQVFTLGRVLGELWLTSRPEESLSERQVRLGHATKTKPEELK
jgi:endonuclease YncB( thermonuclease family)